MRISEDEFQLYLFSRKYRGWHSYAGDGQTLRAVRRLAGAGLIQVNRFRQFRATTPEGEGL